MSRGGGRGCCPCCKVTFCSQPTLSAHLTDSRRTKCLEGCISKCHLSHHITPNSDTNFCTFFWAGQSRAPHGSNEILSRSSGLGSLPLSSDSKFGGNNCISPPQQGFRKFAAVLKHDFSGECLLHIFPEAGISQVCRCNQSRFWGECLYLFSPEAGVSEFCLCNQALLVSEYLHYSPEVGISEACRWIMSVIFRAKCGFRKFVVVLGECLHVTPDGAASKTRSGEREALSK